jgi:hypothetical protein
MSYSHKIHALDKRTMQRLQLRGAMTANLPLRDCGARATRAAPFLPTPSLPIRHDLMLFLVLDFDQMHDMHGEAAIGG